MIITNIESLLLYRDALMLIVNKPAGIPVHKGTGGGETLDDHFDALRFGLPSAPALAHRLDRDTSGCLILGRNRHALQTLGKLFSQNKIEKTYWAITQGIPPQSEGIIDTPLAKRSSHSARWQMRTATADDENALPTLTHYKVLASHNGHAWLALYPKTGRTHQLRVHCTSIGCPIIGDRIYGTPAPNGFLQLHAQAISIPLYPKKAVIHTEAPAPAHMQEALKELGLNS